MGNHFNNVSIVAPGNYFLDNRIRHRHLLHGPLRSPPLVDGTLRRLLRFLLQSGVVSGKVSYGCMVCLFVGLSAGSFRLHHAD